MEDTLNANVTYSNNELNDINNNNYSANQASNSLNVTSLSCVCKKDLQKEKSFEYLNKNKKLTYYCIDCLIPNMFKDIKNIENFKLFLKDYDAEIKIKEINFKDYNIKLEIKAKGKWEQNIKKAYLIYAIPEKGILSNEYEINFKDGMIVSDTINLNLKDLKNFGEITIFFIIRPTKLNYFYNLENMIIKLLV